MLLSGGCAANLGPRAGDGGADAANANDAADAIIQADASDPNDASDASDAPACTGSARQDCVADQCTAYPQFARVCQAGVWVCPAPYQPLPLEPCCARQVCLQQDGSLTNQVCTAGIPYCQTGTQISPGADASTDACSSATTESACGTLAGCHAVYTAEPRTPVGSCTCPDFGCCTHFSFCAAGSHAMCAGGVSCGSAAPYCEPTYSVANDGSCYVGCVRSSACSP